MDLWWGQQEVNIERSGQGQSLSPDYVIQCYLRDLLIHTVTQVTLEVRLAMPQARL